MSSGRPGVALRPRVERLRPEPIIDHGALDGYGPIFNAGLLHHDGRYHLFARAVRTGYRRNPGAGPRFLDYISDIAVFTSHDGHSYDDGYVLGHAGDHGVSCFEDPRVQRVHTEGSPTLVMTYTNLPPATSGRPWRIGAHRLRYLDGRFELDARSGRLLGPDAVPNKDAVVFDLADGRIALLHRIHPDVQLAVFEDLDHLWHAGAEYWDGHLAAIEEHTILRPVAGASGVGAGAPPIATDEGLLLFFHERRADGTYTMNLALLDPTTGRVRARLDDAVFHPELPWERHGDVDNVVFVQGAHLRDDGTVYLTYGAADRCVGAATASVAELLDALRI